MRTRFIIITLSIFLFMSTGQAIAGVIGSAGPTYPTSVAVGETNIPVAISVENKSTTPQNTCSTQFAAIAHTTSCGDTGSLSLCDNPDPGVFEVVNCDGTSVAATGSSNAGCAGSGNPYSCCTGAGTGTCNACDGVNFVCNVVDVGTGKVQFTRQDANPIVLGAPNSLTAGCAIDFLVNALALPTVDGSPPPFGLDGIQTWQLASAEPSFGTTASCANPAVGSAAGSSAVTVEGCGDGIVNGDEFCDDGNDINDDGCRNDCTACGDGVVNDGETCDDGNTDDLDACGNDCLPNICGDGVVNNGEVCDDGNDIDTDACRNDCTPPQNEATCRTPGFWGTHAGAVKTNSDNITQLVIDLGGGSLDVCGQCISTTVPVNDASSAVEAICVSPSGDIVLQNARQLTALALNCIVSGFGSDCSGDAYLADLFSDCNNACTDVASTRTNEECRDEIDCFNNGGNFDLSTGCTLLTDNCHERILGVCEDGTICTVENTTDGICDSDGSQCNPGPAGSSRDCNIAIKNHCAVLPLDNCSAKGGQGEACCGSDSCPL